MSIVKFKGMYWLLHHLILRSCELLSDPDNWAHAKAVFLQPVVMQPALFLIQPSVTEVMRLHEAQKN